MYGKLNLFLAGLLMTLALGAFGACASGDSRDDQHDHGADDGHDHDDPQAYQEIDKRHEAERVFDAFASLDSLTALNMGLRTVSIEPQLHYDRIKIPGRTAVDPDLVFEVSAPATVRILELDARVPAAVRPGDRLAVLELVDSEIRDLQMRAVEVRAQQLADALEQDRLTRYLESLRSAPRPADTEIERVSADLRVLEAQMAARRSTLDALLEALRTAGLDARQLRELADSGKISTRVTVRVPAVNSGSSLEVVDRPVHQGETVPAGATLYNLVGLDRLWVEGEAFEADLVAVRRAAREGLPVSILFPAGGRQVTDLRIIALEGELDGANRITHFFVHLPNELIDERIIDGHRYEEWAFHAGTRVQILVATEEAGERYVVPARAIVRRGGQAWVFVRDHDGFARLPVPFESIGVRDAVLPFDCGLRPGDEIVVSGALQLSLAMEQSEGPQAVDPHAGHSH